MVMVRGKGLARKIRSAWSNLSSPTSTTSICTPRPAVSLFERRAATAAATSATGCIRVQKPADLAAWGARRDQGDWISTKGAGRDEHRPRTTTPSA